MFRPNASSLLAALLLALLATSSPADEPDKAALDENDPLYRALLELRRDLQGLRGDIDGLNDRRQMGGSAPRSMKPAMSPANDREPAPRLPAIASPRRVSQPQSQSISPSDIDHWSFRPVASPAPPAVRDEAWPRDELDRFVLARLDAAGLTPSPDADRYTLVRRLAFDLTGLPPTVEEIRDFVQDPAPLDEALVRVVDAYLDSPRFGERWGRHWLDVARYADSVGRNWNAPFTYAWRYRDYVIDAFNANKPYDQFIVEQLAGDLLPADDLATRRERLVATAFLALGPMNIIEPEGESLMMDRVDEQIDVTTRAMLGLTVSCARCHDHKYEPVTMRDYYALAGVFYSTETLSGQRRGNYVADDDLLLLPSPDGAESPVPGVHSMGDISREFRSGGWREVLYTTDPNLAMGVTEGRVEDCPIRLDGEAYKRGQVPPRGDFRIAGLSGLEGIDPDSSGRLQLARWIASPENPLTARVMANRVWKHLFGQGLVASVDNFGVSGQSPTHPELLDHLAGRLVHSRSSLREENVAFAQRSTTKWSLKSLIRSIVLSRTYRQSSAARSEGLTLDPANELYWRMNLKRLEVEPLRDAMLAVSGRLSFERPEGIQVAGTGGKGRWGLTRPLLDIDSPFRTVYLPVLRSLLPEMYSTFDFPNPTQIQGHRDATTVAPQALFLMNADFAVDCARDAADALLDDATFTDAERVRRVYLRLLGRPADDEETDACLDFLDEFAPDSTHRYRWSALIQAVMLSGEFRTLL